MNRPIRPRFRRRTRTETHHSDTEALYRRPASSALLELGNQLLLERRIEPSLACRHRPEHVCEGAFAVFSRPARGNGPDCRRYPRHIQNARPEDVGYDDILLWSHDHHLPQRDGADQIRIFWNRLLERHAAWMIAVWTRAPTPASSRKVHPGTIDKLLKKHRIRKITAEELLAVLREPAMTVAPGVAESACQQIRMLFERIEVVNEQLKQCRHDAQRVLEEMAGDDEGRSGQRDVAIILSLPGVGSITCATLLAEASRAIRDRDYRALRSLSGVAPVTRRSGKRKLTIVMRQACNDRLRNAMYHAARVACQHDGACKARYQALRSRGHSHGRALRSIADRMLGILMAMLRTQTTYRVDDSQAA